VVEYYDPGGDDVPSAPRQVWVNAKQKEIEVRSMQLFHESAPHSSLLLAVAALVMEQPPLALYEGGITAGGPLTYNYTTTATATIAVNALLSLAVSFFTFFVISSTSSLTYNIVGDITTYIIIVDGVLLFGESLLTTKVPPAMPWSSATTYKPLKRINFPLLYSVTIFAFPIIPFYVIPKP
jgi:hypothetical protein